MNKTLLLTTLGLLPVSAIAAEGMWQPHQLPGLARQLGDLGIEVPAASLSDVTAHPAAAVVSLGNCSASFVSPEGLVITNHHCVQGTLQHNSDATTDYVEEGFLATGVTNELPGRPGSRVLVTVAVTDVTGTMTAGLDAIGDGLARQQEIERREKALVAGCEQTPGYRCGVHAFNFGLDYHLIRQLEIRDVRLVYAPARAIGNYGGDIDNWMWPRHTGDVSFLRAYVGPDATPADYHVDNVPYRPAHFLNASSRPLKDGDFVMALGYPGTTHRHRLASEAAERADWYYPTRRSLYRQMREVIDRATADRPEAALRYSALNQAVDNVVKNYGGMIEGFVRSRVVASKRSEEQALAAWIAHKPDAGQTSPLEDLRDILAEQRESRDRRMVYEDFLLRRAQLLDVARTLYRLSVEKTRPDAEREPGYQERDWLKIREKLQRLERSFDADVDRALFSHHIALYRALPADQKIAAFDTWLGPAGSADFENRLASMYSGTRLTESNTRMAWLEADREVLEASDDPFVQLAVALYESDMERERLARRFKGRLQQARSRFMAAKQAWLDSEQRALYADANGTLRVTFGTVSGYSPRDAVDLRPFTTLEGVLEKHRGEPPFDAPDALRAAIERRPASAMTVNFLARLDATGGSSGSPVLNAEGELTGLLFDGVYESINTDWYFDPRRNRAISVSLPYVLWIMREVDGAEELLREMGIGPTQLAGPASMFY